MLMLLLLMMMIMMEMMMIMKATLMMTYMAQANQLQFSYLDQTLNFEGGLYASLSLYSKIWGQKQSAN